jgi:hypothetical protein
MTPSFLFILFLVLSLSAGRSFNSFPTDFTTFFQQLATMKCYSAIFIVSLLASAQASVLSTTNIATVLAGATSQSSLTIPAAAMAAIAKLGTGGATASSLSAADKAAIVSCTSATQANNTASKAGLGGGTGTAGNIALSVFTPFRFQIECLTWRIL